MFSKFVIGILVVYAAFTAIGAILFVQEDAEVPFTGDFSELRDNDRPYANGTQVRASSWDWFNQHHPMFAIDGEPHPSGLEKWASYAKDRHPWIELKLATPITVDAVKITHAGRYEDDELTIPNFDISCLDESGDSVRTVEVRGNTDDVTTHEVDCLQTSRVRIQFEVDADEKSLHAVARVYEVEVISGD